MNKELNLIVSACMDSPSRDGHPTFYAALDAKFEEMKAENAMLSERAEADFRAISALEQKLLTQIGRVKGLEYILNEINRHVSPGSLDSIEAIGLIIKERNQYSERVSALEERVKNEVWHTERWQCESALLRDALELFQNRRKLAYSLRGDGDSGRHIAAFVESVGAQIDEILAQSRQEKVDGQG